MTRRNLSSGTFECAGTFGLYKPEGDAWQEGMPCIETAKELPQCRHDAHRDQGRPRNEVEVPEKLAWEALAQEPRGSAHRPIPGERAEAHTADDQDVEEAAELIGQREGAGKGEIGQQRHGVRHCQPRTGKK